VADDVVASLVATRLQRADARAKGWVLDGAPQTRSQARALQAAGVLADKLVVLQLDGKEAVARALASAERPGSESADVLREVQAFERGLNQFLPLYHNRTLLADAAQPREAVAQEVVAFVGRREPSRAPRRPTRALVLGPAGAGKATLCKRLVRQHGLLHVAVGPLLRREMARDAAFAKSIAPFVQAGQLVPDELVCPLVTERLQQSDCRKKGWVLDGFPRTEAQADVLAQQGLTPTRVVWLEAAQDVCRDRLVHRRVDAFSGAVYHLQEAPPNETVQKRLVHMQRDRPEVLANVWANFEAEAPALQTRYADRLRVVSGTRTPDQVLVEVESFLRRALGEPE
jgi:adenylate kinase